MKTKIVDETFDENFGTTTVTIQNKYGHFTGVAYCHPDDTYSMFQGERIAVTKANIEFLKFRIKQTKNMIKALDNLLSDYYLNIDTNPEIFSSPVYQHALTKIEIYNKEIENFKISINILQDSIKKMDKERQDVLHRSKKNK